MPQGVGLLHAPLQAYNMSLCLPRFGRRFALRFTSRSFQDVVGSYFPCNVVALRTLKAEVGCGMKKDLMEAAAVADSNWQVNGNWGVVQFGSPEK
jgi:hypothetical protein